MSLSNLWFKGLTPAEKADTEHNLKNSKITLDIVSKLVYNIYIDTLNVTFSDYDDPSWAFKKAHQEGRIAALEILLTALDTQGDDRALKSTKRKALTDVREQLRSTE